MKLFKIDEKVLFEKHFYKMTFSQFFSLDNIPKDVDAHQMRNLGEFLKNIKEENREINFDDLEIGKVLEELYMENNYEDKSIIN
jgi:hypothetical protein